MYKKITKAVIPAAGFGTRMLPFTKAVPKELIPLVDKPVIEYVVKEAVDSGLNDILLIISAGKDAILNHFKPVPDLEKRLQQSGKPQMLKLINPFDSDLRISCIYQEELNGLGGAVKLAEEFVQDDFFAVLLGDTVLDSTSKTAVTGQLIDAHYQTGNPVIAVEQLPREELGKYGCVGGEWISDTIMQVNAMVEKPLPHEIPGEFAVASRYLLSPEIFPLLKNTVPGKGGEIQLTDAIKQLIPSGKLNACRIAGRRYDLGCRSGFIAANLEFAMRDPDLLREIKDKLARNKIIPESTILK